MSISKMASEFADIKQLADHLHTDAGVDGVGMFLFKFRDILQRNYQELKKNFEEIITAASTPELERVKPSVLKVRALVNDFLKFVQDLDNRAKAPSGQGRTKSDLIDEYIMMGMSHKDAEIGKLMNLVKGKDTLNNLIEALDAVLEYKEGDEGSLQHAIQMSVAFGKQYLNTKSTPVWGKAAAIITALDAMAEKLQPIDEKLAAQIDAVTNTVEDCAKDVQSEKTASAAENTHIQEKNMTQKNFAMLKQASEMQAQAYDLLEKAASIITACNCEGASFAVGDAVPAGIVAPVATPAAPVADEGTTLVIKLADKTASLAILDRVASELKSNESEEIRKMAEEVKAIAETIDKQAKVLEDGMGKDKLVDEMVDSFQGKVYNKGTPQGEASAKAVGSFATDISDEVNNLVRKGYPKV